MKGFFYILCSYLAGEIISVLTGRFMPASVIGMVILFGLLQTRVIKASDVERPAGLLLDNMMLFFVPVAVGMMASFAIIKNHLPAIIISLLISTLLVIMTVGLIQQKLGRR